MKTRILFLLSAICHLLSAMAQEVHDIRTVNGAKVDLGPLKTWYATHQGERPLKHWKQIRVTKIEKQVATYDQVTVTTEEGLSTTILLVNCDPSIRAALLRPAELEAQIAALDQTAAQAKAQAKTGGTIARNRMAANAGATSAAARDQADTLRAEKLKADSNAAKALTLPQFAMATGGKYSGLEIWDCGRKQ